MLCVCATYWIQHDSQHFTSRPVGWCERVSYTTCWNAATGAFGAEHTRLLSLRICLGERGKQQAESSWGTLNNSGTQNPDPLVGSSHQAQHNARDCLILSDPACRIPLARGPQMGCNWYKVPKAGNNDSDLLRVQLWESGGRSSYTMSLDGSAPKNCYQWPWF